MAHLVLYDGVCGLCNRLNRFLWERDRRDVFRFAALQGSLAGRVLHAHHVEAAGVSTFFVVADFGSRGERILDRSRAAAFALRQLGGPWWLARFLVLVPRSFADALYDLLARHRYRLFGRHESCPAPPQAIRSKFVDWPPAVSGKL